MVYSSSKVLVFIMKLTTFDGKLFAYVLAFFIVGYVLNLCSYGYYQNVTAPIEPPEWTTYGRATHSLYRVRDYLQLNGWVDERVMNDELDYILQLTQHLSTYYDDIPTSLAIAVVAQESKFYEKDEYEGAKGLMQLLPSYHRERLIQCIEEDERYSDELFFDPRLNVMTGLDYLHQLLSEVDGDVPYALMCYNQGPSSAYKTYVKGGVISNYAQTIIKLSEELDELLPGS